MSELIKRLKEERIQGSSAVLNYSNFDYWVNWDDIVDIVEDHNQPQLNENQQIVLEWLKKKSLITDIEPIELIWRLRVNSTKEGYRDMPVYKSYRYMTKAGQFQVLAAFAEWGSKGDE